MKTNTFKVVTLLYGCCKKKNNTLMYLHQRNQCCTRMQAAKSSPPQKKKFLLNLDFSNVFTCIEFWKFNKELNDNVQRHHIGVISWSTLRRGSGFSAREERPARGTYPEQIDAINCKLEPKSFLSSKFETLPVWTERDPKHMRLWSKFQNRRDSHSAHVNFALWQSASCRPGRVQ